MPVVKINPHEEFPHLRNAPIVEAVIDFRARAETGWTESRITEALKTLLPDYPKRLSMSGFQHEFTLGPGAVPEGTRMETGWVGLRCQTEDGLHVAQFNRDGFMFARLRPYDQWEQLVGEGLRLWKLFVEIAEPSEIQRMGLRFINRISLPPGDNRIEDYLEPAPAEVRDVELPFQHFFHQDTFGVPGYPYAVRLVRTIQPQQGPDPQSSGIILDIDVFTTQPFEPDPQTIEQRLTEMRWLKNKMFFGSVASKALEAFG